MRITEHLAIYVTINVAVCLSLIKINCIIKFVTEKKSFQNKQWQMRKKNVCTTVVGCLNVFFDITSGNVRVIQLPSKGSFCYWNMLFSLLFVG